jgi:hypothetical protein
VYARLQTPSVVRERALLPRRARFVARRARVATSKLTKCMKGPFYKDFCNVKISRAMLYCARPHGNADASACKSTTLIAPAPAAEKNFGKSARASLSQLGIRSESRESVASDSRSRVAR